MSEDRKHSYKNFGKDEHDRRQKRTNEMVELRKKRKNDLLTVKRNIHPDAGDEEAAGEENRIQQSDIDIALGPIALDLSSEYDPIRLRGLQLAYKLWRQIFPPIDKLISFGIVTKCVRFLQMSDNTDIQFFSAWVVGFIATINKDIVVESNAIEPLIKMLASPHPQIVEQSCSALGNCMDDAPQYRDQFIEMGLISSLALVLDVHAGNLPVLRKLAWTLSIIVQGSTERRNFSSALFCIQILARLIALEDLEVLANTLIGFSYLCEGCYDKIPLVVEAGVVPRILNLLDSGEVSVVLSSLYIIANIVGRTSTQAKIAVNSGILPKVIKHLQNPDINIVERAAALLANISYRSLNQTSAVMESGAIPFLFNLIDTSSFTARDEALWVIKNITSEGFDCHITTLRELGLIPLLYRCLNVPCWRVVHIAMDIIEDLLKAARFHNHIEQMYTFLEEGGCIDKMEKLIYCENDFITVKAKNMVELYFDARANDTGEQMEAMDVNVSREEKMEF